MNISIKLYSCIYIYSSKNVKSGNILWYNMHNFVPLARLFSFHKPPVFFQPDICLVALNPAGVTDARPSGFQRSGGPYVEDSVYFIYFAFLPPDGHRPDGAVRIVAYNHIDVLFIYRHRRYLPQKYPTGWIVFSSFGLNPVKDGSRSSDARWTQ